MKLYDVIRKENLEHGKKFADIPSDPDPSPRPHYVRRPLGWRKIVIGGCAILFLVILYVAGMKMVRAKVIVTERHIPFSLDGVEFELTHEGDASTGRLSFQTMVVPTEVSRQVYGSKVEESNSLAKGKVVFFNEYSTKTQTIKAKTTLTSATGKKYQTTAAVSVPGYTTKGKVKTAGTSIATAVVATAVGPSYNTTGTTFTVSGWGAKQLYAQSAGAITGGEDGVAHSLSPEEQKDATTTLQAQLIERLKRETRTQVPDNLLVFPDMQVTTIDHDSIVLRGTSLKFPAKIAGSMSTYLIPREELETAIAHEVLHDRTYPYVSIPSISDLTVVPVSALPTDPSRIPETIRVKITGEGVIITKAPVESIAGSLVGVRKGAVSSILEKVPEVDSARYHLYPFWAPFFPSKQSRIMIETK